MKKPYVIQKDSITLGALKKSDAFNMVRDLAEKETDPKQKVELERLMLYFAPPKARVARTALEWVASSVDTSDIREYMTYVWVWNGTAYGTNGHVIHYAKVDVPDGAYDPVTLSMLGDDTFTKHKNTWTEEKVLRVANFYNEKAFDVDTKDKEFKLVVTDTNKKRPKEDAVYKLHYEESVNREVQVQKIYLDRATNGNDITLTVFRNGGQYILGGESEFGKFTIACLRA